MKVREVLTEDDGKLGGITPHNVGEKYQVGKVLINNENGLGATPNNRDVNYKGFVIFIKPSKFLQLCVNSDDRTERAVGMEAATLEKGIGNPDLKIVIDHEQTTFKVVGHEGRARMTLIKKLNGDEPVPVHVIIGGVMKSPDELKQDASSSMWKSDTWELRAKNVKPSFFDRIKTGKITSERNVQQTLDVQKIFWMGKEL